MPSLDTTRLETFVLARILLRPKSGLGLSDVRRQLSPYVSHVLTDSAWRRRLAELVESARAAGFVKADALELTEAGEAEILGRLMLSKAPTAAAWPKFVAEVVVPAAMGFNPEQARVETSDDLVALLLAREFALPAKGRLSLPKVLNALVWRALGVESDERLTAGALQRAVLRKHLNGTRLTDPERMARILAAKVGGARSAGAQPARQAVLREWLGGGPKKQGALADPENMKIESFAEAALNAARDPQTVRFGTHKAFIDSVFERFRTALNAPIELTAFKKKLVAAHRQGLLTLARADLVEAMDPERVAASETHYLNTTFHFVEAD